MLQEFRKSFQGVFGKTIIGSIILTLSVFGFGSLTWFATGEDAVAVVNGEPITASQLRVQVEQQQASRAQQIDDDPEALEDLKSDRFASQVLDEMVVEEVIRQNALSGGWEVADEALDLNIRENPDFQIDGQYDPELFLQASVASGFTAISYRRRLADFILIRDISIGIAETDFVLPNELDQAISILGETRDLSWLILPNAVLEGSITIPPEEISEDYELNQADYVTPDQVVVNYIEVSRDDLAKNIEVAEESIEAAYEAEKEQFEPEEQRRAAHILLRTSEERSIDQAISELEALVARTKNGENFGDLAKAYSEDGGSAEKDGDLGMSARGIFVPEFEEALWALEVNELSEPVQSQFGVHLIKLLEVGQSSFPSYEDRKAQLRNDIAQNRAVIQFEKKSVRLSEISYESGDLSVVSETLELPIMKTEPFSLKGDYHSDPQEGLVVYQAFREAAFSEDVRELGYNSPLLDLEEGLAVVLRVATSTPGRQQSFEEATPLITKKLRQQEAIRKTGLRMNAAREKLLSGESKAKIAEELDLTWEDRAQVSRGYPGVPQAILQAAFEAPKPKKDNPEIEIANTSEGVALVTISNAQSGQQNPLFNEEVIAQQAETLLNLFGNSSLNVFRSGLASVAEIDKAGIKSE